MGVSVVTSSVVMFSLGALTASLVCWLCNPKRSKKDHITITNTTARIHSLDPVHETPDEIENAIYTKMGQSSL